MAAVLHYGRIGKQFFDRKTFEFSFRIECRVRASALNIYSALEEILHPNDITEIARTDSLMWNIVVGSETAASILRDCGVIKINGRDSKVVSISNQVTEIRCHWLPSFVKDEFLKFIFNDYGRVQGIRRETTVLGAGLSRQNGVRVVTLETDDILKGTIPHLLRFEGNISMLVTMAGRPPLCLRCNNIGHLRRDCNVVINRPTVPQQQQRSYAAAAAATVPAEPQKRDEKDTEQETEDSDTVMEEREVEEAVTVETEVEKDSVVNGDDQEEKETSESQGVRRRWEDSEGFDLLAASEGQLYDSEWTTVKRSKKAPDRSSDVDTDEA